MNKYTYNAKHAQLTESEQAYQAIHRVMCKAYKMFTRNRLSDCLPDGTIHGQDAEFILIQMIEHFAELQWYERCAFLKGLLDELPAMKKAKPSGNLP